MDSRIKNLFLMRFVGLSMLVTDVDAEKCPGKLAYFETLQPRRNFNQNKSATNFHFESLRLCDLKVGLQGLGVGDSKTLSQS